MLPPRTRTALTAFATRVRERFRSRVARLVLFGSHARGEATEDSDVDVLVVLEDLTPADLREIDAITGDLLTETDVLLAPLVLSRARFEALQARERRLPADIDREGVPL